MFVLQIIGYIFFGGAVIVGAVFGFAWYVAKEINQGHGQGCACNACQLMRQKQWRARHPAAERTGRIRRPGQNTRVNQSRPAPDGDRKTPPGDDWASTLELRAGQRIYDKSGQVFRVHSVTPISYGYMVVLEHLMTKKPTRIPIKAEDATHRIWHVRKSL